MKAHELVALLANVPADAEIVVGGSDHTYRICDVRKTTAMRIGRDFWEDHGEVETKATGKRVPVVAFIYERIGRP